jgi:uncharacterized OB-fold protein
MVVLGWECTRYDFGQFEGAVPIAGCDPWPSETIVGGEMSKVAAGTPDGESASRRPVPVPDRSSAGFWEAAKRNVLAIARCSRCSAYSHPPDEICSNCGSMDPEFVFQAVSGRGKIMSWTIVRQALLPGFEVLVPYTLVDVELVEQHGLRITGRLFGGGDVPIALGQPVHVMFEQIAPDIAVPAFVQGERS